MKTILRGGGMIHIDFNITKDCKNLVDSYGTICVKCNACGRFDKKTQKQCYLRVLKEHLKEQKEFNDWDNEPKLRKLQEENIKANIKSIRQKIKEAEKAK